MSEHIISMIVAHKVGALSRITNILSRKQLNIKSLSIITQLGLKDPRITVVMDGNEDDAELASRLLAKNEDVISIGRYNQNEILQREMIMLKTDLTDENLEIINRMSADFDMTILRQSGELIAEYVGSPSEADLFVELADKLKPLDLHRTSVATLVELR